MQVKGVVLTGIRDNLLVDTSYVWTGAFYSVAVVLTPFVDMTCGWNFVKCEQVCA